VCVGGVCEVYGCGVCGGGVCVSVCVWCVSMLWYVCMLCVCVSVGVVCGVCVCGVLGVGGCGVCVCLLYYCHLCSYPIAVKKYIVS